MKKQFKELSLNRQFFVRYIESPAEFAKVLLTKSENVASTLLKSPLLSTNPLAVVSVGIGLLDFRWSDENANLPRRTILESLRATANNESLEVWSTGIVRRLVGIGVPFGFALQRDPAFWTWEGTTGTDAARLRGNFPDLRYAISGPVLTDYSPSVRNFVNGEVVGAFCRNAIPLRIYDTAKQVLQLTLPPSGLKMIGTSGNWVAIRLLPNGIPQIDRLLANLDTFFQSVLEGFEDVGGAIVQYIEFIQARIRNLQALLDQIQGLIDYIRSLTLPPVSALVIAEEGIGGLITGLVGAENKPQDSSLSYGFGFAAVGIGLPVLLTDLLAAVFGTPANSGA